MPARKQELVERYEQTKLRKLQDVAYLDDNNENDDVIMDDAVHVSTENDQAYVMMLEVLMADDYEEQKSDHEFELIDWATGIE
jgi:hypothetical protein